jgi:hypothetical protein
MKCTNCGNDVPDTAKICGYCGHPLKILTNQTVGTPSTPGKKSSPGWIWAVITALGIIILAGILFALLWRPSIPSAVPEVSAQIAAPEGSSEPPPQEGTAACEDKLVFISDVSVPDGTVFGPGESFSKTWRIKNSGTCTWTATYKLTFRDGDQMGGPQSVPLSKSVSPSDEVDISINLTSPNEAASYKGFWQLRNMDGVVVPIESVGHNSVFVDITVQTMDPAQTDENSLSDIILNAELIYKNRFDEKPSWNSWGTVNVADGKMIIEGVEGNGSGFTSGRSIENIGQTILVRFQGIENTRCNLKLITGKWGTESWRGVGIDFDLGTNKIMTDVEYGKSPDYLGGKLIPGNLMMTPNKNYYYLIGISAKGAFDARLWEAENIANNKTVTWQLGSDWEDLEWKFEPWCGKGQMKISDYYEINLDIRNVQMP